MYDAIHVTRELQRKLAPRPRHTPPRLIHALIIAIIFEALLQLPPQPSLLLNHTPPCIQGLAPALIHRIEPNHALAVLVVEVGRRVVVHVNHRLARPGGGHEEGVQGIGELGAPRGGVGGHGGRHGQVLGVAGAVAADEGEDEEGGGEVEDQGYEERDEDALSDVR